ncbi:hypothetical protein BH11BAC7_BH11BAC7_11960 [soil metagenome]
MTTELRENEKTFYYEDLKKICLEWTSSKANGYSTAEVVGLMLACFSNLQHDEIYSNTSNLREYAELFTPEEITFLKWLRSVAENNPG